MKIKSVIKLFNLRKTLAALTVSLLSSCAYETYPVSSGYGSTYYDNSNYSTPYEAPCNVSSPSIFSVDYYRGNRDADCHSNQYYSQNQYRNSSSYNHRNNNHQQHNNHYVSRNNYNNNHNSHNNHEAVRESYRSSSREQLERRQAAPQHENHARPEARPEVRPEPSHVVSTPSEHRESAPREQQPKMNIQSRIKAAEADAQGRQ